MKLRWWAPPLAMALLGVTSASADDHEGWGVVGSAAASVDNGALAFAVGPRYAVTEQWVVGLDVEYNPWFSFEATRFARGAFNTYATGTLRYWVSDEVALRVTAQVGASVLLFDLVGAPAGSVGPLVGGNLLGISYEVADQIYVFADPMNVVIPVPQIQGAPFSYLQYRLTIGAQFGG
ncbi:MAG: hypothetical protein AAGA56_17330 [Myxococcota bacterium]